MSGPAGEILAKDELGAGYADPEPSACVFEFRVHDIPAGLGFYGLAVGSDDRGTMKYEETEISGREINLSLGL